MTTFSDGVFQYGGSAIGTGGDISLNGGNTYFVDPVNGLDGNDGMTPGTARKTLAQGYALLVDAHNDTLVILGTATGLDAVAGLDWDKSYCHLVGATAPMSLGQRARITGSATSDPTYLITFSGSANTVRNVQFFNGADAAATSGAVIVSGDRNYFENCFFAGMGHATAGAQAGGYSLTVSGSENKFKGCTIGLDTIVRVSTNAELIVSGPRNRFVGCDIRKYSITTGNFLVTIDTTIDTRDTIFDRCYFFCYSPNWAAGCANAFNITGAGNTYWVILSPDCMFVGTSITVANTVSHIYTTGVTPAGTNVLIAVTPST